MKKITKGNITQRRPLTDYINKNSKLPYVTIKDCLLRMWEIYTTRFGRKGPSSGNTYIKIIKKNYWVVSGMYINEILCSFFWAITRRLNIQTPSNCPKERIKHSELCESLKSIKMRSHL